MLPDSLTHEIIVLPFVKGDLYLGLAEASGLAKASQSNLTLEFEVKENVSGSSLLKSAIKEVTIPIGEIDAVRLKKGIFSTTLVLKTKSVNTLKDVPGSHQGQVELGISRNDRDLAQRLISTLMLYISENELKKVENRLNLLSDT